MSRQTRRAVIILIGLFVILTPLALSLVNRNTNLSGAAVVTNEQTDGGDSGASDAGNPPPPDTSAQQDTSAGDSSAAQPSGDQGNSAAVEPTEVPATAVPPTDVPPTAVPPTPVPPTDVPPTQTPVPVESTAEPTTPAESTNEAVVGETPTAEETEAPTVTPEATSELEVTAEVTPEETLEPEVTPELTPEATAEISGFDLGASCTSTGVDFTITNLGEDMSAAEAYSIDGADSGSLQLASGASETVHAGFGSPSLSFAGSSVSVDTPCEPPPQLSVSLECSLDSGVIFTVVNAGGAMESEQTYSIENPGAESSSGSFQLGAGESTTIQAGYGEPTFTSDDLSAQTSPACTPPAHVEGRVWQDLNNDGLDSADEPGIAGVIVSLTNDDGSTVQTVTAEDGHYDFFPVGEGHYLVTLEADSLPTDTQLTVDPDGEKDAVAGVNVDAGEVYTVSFGYQSTGTASIAGLVWLETGNWGVLDAGEKGVVAATVQLLDADGVVLAETGVSADGFYRFDKLSAGNYVVRLVADTLPQPYGVTFDSDGDHNTETFISLSSGQTVENVNFGIVGTF